MTLPPDIRRATADDLDALRALAESTFRQTFAADNTADDMEAYAREAFSRARLAVELADPACTFLLAFSDSDAPAGYAKLRKGTPHSSVRGDQPIEIERLYADADAIGRGIGTALMWALLDRAAAGGFRTVWLGVWERNALAIAFYERWGFRRVGTHVFRLGSDDQTDLIMERPVAHDDGSR